MASELNIWHWSIFRFGYYTWQLWTIFFVTVRSFIRFFLWNSTKRITNNRRNSTRWQLHYSCWWDWNGRQQFEAARISTWTNVSNDSNQKFINSSFRTSKKWNAVSTWRLRKANKNQLKFDRNKNETNGSRHISDRRW